MFRLPSMTWNWLKSHIWFSLTVTLIFFVGLQAIMLIDFNNKLQTTILLTFFVLLAVFLSGFSFGYRNIKNYQKRLEDLSAFIAILARGNLKHRMTLQNPMNKLENDEIGKCTEELNQLATKVQGQVQSLQRLVDKNADLAQKAHQSATEDERQRLARDLHDAVSQQLFALNMMTSACIRVVEHDVEKAKQQMIEIAEMAGNAQAEMRALLLHLRPAHLSKDSLHIGVMKLIEELKSKCNISFETNIEEVTHISKGMEDHIFRIIQESLSNVLRHADATVVKLNLYTKDGVLRLHIGDNGKGFDMTKEKKASYGLNTMRERCEEIGGDFSIQSKQGEGTYILIKIPFQIKEGTN
jgi:two-component system, NarL family, sensor histidine kinase LiaS